MITSLIILGIVLYLSISLWVTFNGLVGGGIPIVGLGIENTTTLIIVSIVTGLLWPILLFVPIVDWVTRFLRSF